MRWGVGGVGCVEWGMIWVGVGIDLGCRCGARDGME